jgi:hypothetical protein
MVPVYRLKYSLIKALNFKTQHRQGDESVVLNSSGICSMVPEEVTVPCRHAYNEHPYCVI